MDGWVKIHRKVTEWEWYQDGNVFRVFLHLLLTANHKDNKWQGILIGRGQVVTSVDSIFNGLNRNRVTGKLVRKTERCTIQNIRTALHRLVLTNEITIKTTCKYSLVTLHNYDEYQDTNKQTNTKLTNNSQTSNKQVTTNKNDKNDKNDKNKYMSAKADESFDKFWTVYPKKELKKKTIEIWKRKNLDAKIDEIVEFVEKAKLTDRWVKGYIKQPTTFLNNESWKDDLSSYGDVKQNINNVYRNKTGIDTKKIEVL